MPQHDHPFWQAEFIFTGKVRASLRDTSLELRRGDVLFIPPKVEHGFHYERERTSYCSLKFAVPSAGSGFTIQHLAGEPFLEHTRQGLEALLDSSGRPLPHRAPVADHLLSSMLAFTYPALCQELGEMQSAVDRAKQIVAEHHGQPMTVRELAKRVGLSMRHFSELFHEQEGVAPKIYLDRCRGVQAAKLLNTTKMNISEIAYHFGFPDPFSFSRFFKKLYGQSPAAFRQGIHQPHT
jgi:AraC-like DNA-binding protein